MMQVCGFIREGEVWGVRVFNARTTLAKLMRGESFRGGIESERIDILTALLTEKGKVIRCNLANDNAAIYSADRVAVRTYKNGCDKYTSYSMSDFVERF